MYRDEEGFYRGDDGTVAFDGIVVGPTSKIRKFLMRQRLLASMAS